MILFPDDVQAIGDLLRQRAGMDPELLAACEEHIAHRRCADAVFMAFRVLEGRIQQRGGIHGEGAAGRVAYPAAVGTEARPHYKAGGELG